MISRSGQVCAHSVPVAPAWNFCSKIVQTLASADINTNGASATTSRRRDVVALAPFVLISALASVWTIFEQKFHAGATGTEWAQTWPDRLIIAGRAIWFYLAKLIWPHPLIFIYPRWQIDSSQVTAYLPLLVALGGLLALRLNRAKWSRAVFFAATYYVVSLFPVLGFFSVYFFRYSFVSDHFQYLSSLC